MSELHEFTKRAIEMARESDRTSFEHSSPIEQEHKRTITLRITNGQIDMIFKALDALESKSKEQIKRAINFPTDTIRSSVTKERHEGIIDSINTLRSHIAEETAY